MDGSVDLLYHIPFNHVPLWEAGPRMSLQSLSLLSDPLCVNNEFRLNIVVTI